MDDVRCRVDEAVGAEVSRLVRSSSNVSLREIVGSAEGRVGGALRLLMHLVRIAEAAANATYATENVIEIVYEVFSSGSPQAWGRTLEEARAKMPANHSSEWTVVRVTRQIVDPGDVTP